MVSRSRLASEIAALLQDGEVQRSKADDIARLIVSSFEEMQRKIADLERQLKKQSR